MPAKTWEPFSQANKLVDVHGHAMNIYCSGTGSPTVVFDAPSGEAGWTWWAVQPKVSKQTRACVYDRPGFGYSEFADRPKTSADAVEDLHTLLSAAGEKPPYVLVGNSLGGANVQLFAYHYPTEVQGLVLVEAMREDQEDRLAKASNGKTREFDVQMLEGGKACAALAEKGFAADGRALAECTGGIGNKYPGKLATTRYAALSNATYWRAAMAEAIAFNTDQQQLKAARTSFGDLPLIVLVRGVSPFMVPGKPQSALNKAVEQENKSMQVEVAMLSKNGKTRVVSGAGHNIQEDKPGAVVKAVDEVLSLIKH